MISTSALIDAMLGSLSDRNRDVVMRRFGLATGSAQTLERIGQDLGITRERVRQIEKSSLTMIAAHMPKSFNEFSHVAHEHLALFSGARDQERFLVELSYLIGSGAGSAAQIRFLLLLDQSLLHVSEDHDVRAFWAAGKPFADKVLKFVQAVNVSLRKRSTPVSMHELEAYVRTCAKKTGFGTLAIGTLMSLMSLSKVATFGPFGYLGSQHLKAIAPVNVGDRAYTVLKHSAQPLHFRDLASAINAQAKFATAFHPSWQKEVDVQTVHNDLIKNQNFVLVGRGIYALREWGYQAGTVRQILCRVLQKAGKPLLLEAISKQVKKMKIVKDSTILINLQNRRFFKRMPDRRYTLVRIPRRVEEA
jgi:DNA-directed RNA polymerase delta subunit